MDCLEWISWLNFLILLTRELGLLVGNEKA
jgi:hypothetical protein